MTSKIEEIFEKKRQFHRNQARLPIEEKIRILIELQKIVLNIRKQTGKSVEGRLWKIEN